MSSSCYIRCVILKLGWLDLTEVIVVKSNQSMLKFKIINKNFWMKCSHWVVRRIL